MLDGRLQQSGDHRCCFGCTIGLDVSNGRRPPERLAAHRAHLAIPFTIVTDPDRELYRLLGAEVGSARQIWSLGTIRMYARLMLRGRRLRKPTEDIHQLGADAVIGRDGKLRYLSLPSTPDCRPPVMELIAALD